MDEERKIPRKKIVGASNYQPNRIPHHAVACRHEMEVSTPHVMGVVNLEPSKR